MNDNFDQIVAELNAKEARMTKVENALSLDSNGNVAAKGYKFTNTMHSVVSTTLRNFTTLADHPDLQVNYTSSVPETILVKLMGSQRYYVTDWAEYYILLDGVVIGSGYVSGYAANYQDARAVAIMGRATGVAAGNHLVKVQVKVRSSGTVSFPAGNSESVGLEVIRVVE